MKQEICRYIVWIRSKLPKAFAPSLLLLLLPYVALSQQRTQQSESGEQNSTAYLFVSPNTSKGLTFHQATRNLRSRDEIVLIKSARVLLCRLGASARITPSIGSWSDGVENSLLLRGTFDRNSLRYISAALGHRAHQKSVLYFRTDANGPATLYTFRLGRRRASLKRIAEFLEKSGIQFRTIVPLRNATAVYVVDQEGGLKQRVFIAASRLNARFSSVAGTSEFIGDDTSTASAEQVYSPIIKQFESSHAPSGNRCGVFP